MTMLRKNLILILVATGLFFPLVSALAAKKAPAKEVTALMPTPSQSEAGIYITQYLLQNHYRKVAVNDSLSLQIFNRYIDNLDGSRSYFLASDVEDLKKRYGTRIDDDFLAGVPTAGFEIYNFFLKRAKEKVEFMRTAVDTVNFRFTAPDSIDIDRKHDLWAADRRELLDLWRKELKYQWLNLKYSGEATKSVRGALAKSFSSRLNLLNRLKPEDAFQAYMYAVTTSFDPHTSYFSPDEYANFQIDMSRSLEGIGAKLQTEGEYTVINEVIPGGPAFRSNQLKKGDKIIGVGQGKAGEIVDVTAWRINEVVKLIRGKKGTVVRLKILPVSQRGSGPAIIVRLVRDKVDLKEQAAKKRIILQNGKKIGVITLPSFYLDFEGQQRNTGNYNSTSTDVLKILQELQAASVDGIVIDLRNNGGGSLEEAVKVTGLFIPGGPVVQISNARGATTVLNDADIRVQFSGPLAVLVNRYSASASEIVAAAIQDYGRGVVIGERTFGKGTVQSIIRISRPITLSDTPVDLGEVKLTIAKFYRISGGSTQHKGVEPDLVMPSMIDTATVGEDTYTSSLPFSTISPANYQPVAALSQAEIGVLRQKELERAKANPLYQTYLRDLKTIDLIRKRKGASLQETAFKSAMENIKKIEKQWALDSSKESDNDLLLIESAGVVSDMAKLRDGK
ncbi:carboxyl-terminal protease [Chlorobium ferrooxidans DSM 13031]|uniref:Carboxyl-terminal protease n=2 Tax=Chlorobium TaxID=1091 RepID=Q0YV24_9CHLB|nr:carboxyl-terminal protease [Chlorobium ferrooxidans DSM 13031]